MDLFEFAWNMRHDQRLSDSQAAMRSASSQLDSTQADLAMLRAAVDRLALVNQALWELVRDHTNLSDEELTKRVAELDLRDGRPDKRMGGTTIDCKQCGRPNRSDRARCIYCNAVQ